MSRQAAKLKKAKTTEQQLVAARQELTWFRKAMLMLVRRAGRIVLTDAEAQELPDGASVRRTVDEENGVVTLEYVELTPPEQRTSPILAPGNGAGGVLPAGGGTVPSGAFPPRPDGKPRIVS